MRGVVSCAAVALFSCASSQRGFDRGALRTEETAAMPLQITDAEIGEALSRRPQLPPRFRLAIYARDAEPERAWRWSGREKDRILEAIDPLVSEGVVGDAFFLTSLVVDTRISRRSGWRRRATAPTRCCWSPVRSSSTPPRTPGR